MTAAVLSPTPGMSCRRPFSSRRSSSSIGTRFDLVAPRAGTPATCRRGSRPRTSRSAMRSRASTGVTPRTYPLGHGRSTPSRSCRGSRTSRSAPRRSASSASACAPDLHGDVVELGFGSGLEPAAPPARGHRACGRSTRRVSASKLAAKRIAAHSVPVHAAGLDGARLDLPDDRFDSALSTMTLCTIPDVERALARVAPRAEAGRRVPLRRARARARREGRAHTRSASTACSRRFAGGCHLEPRHRRAHRGGRLRRSTRSTNFYPRGAPKAWSYMFVGRGPEGRDRPEPGRILAGPGGLTEWPKVLAC